MKAELKWSQTLPARHPDTIISSDVKLKGQRGFTPSYEKNPKEYNMFWVLSNEYQRIWTRERDDYSKYQYSALETLQSETLITRKYVKKKPKRTDGIYLPPIKLKRFQNVQSKTESRRAPVCK